MENKILQNIIIDFIKPLSTINKKEEIIDSLKKDKWIITKFNTYPTLGKCISIEKDDKTYFIENIPLSIFKNDDIMSYFADRWMRDIDNKKRYKLYLRDIIDKCIDADKILEYIIKEIFIKKEIII